MRSAKIVQMMNLSWPLTFQQKGQIYFLMHLYWKKYWKFHFSRTIEGWCLIFGTNVLLTKNMEMYQCQGCWNTFVSRSHEFRFSNDVCCWPVWQPCPYMVKTLRTKKQGTLKLCIKHWWLEAFPNSCKKG